MQSWLEGRNWVGKCAQATGMTTNLIILSSKADSNTWESFTSSELKLESVNQESPRSDIFRKRATKPLLNQKHRQKHLTWAKEKNNWTVAQWSKVLFSDESKFCISFENQGPRVWRKSGEAQNLLLEVQCEVSTVSDDMMRDTRHNNADDLKAAIKETWASNLYKIWVSLSEMSCKKYWPFSCYSISFRCTCTVIPTIIQTPDKVFFFY